MKYIFFLFTFSIMLFASGSFITEAEYAAELYKNPRGIGCGECHGAHGEGKVIAEYIHKNKQRKFIGPAINHLSYRDFFQALNSRKRGMPHYYLTDQEIKALYFFLHHKQKVEE